ncbi:MAG: hypothetical protein KF824_13165 [Fimbriimonadaceae bacterium]|nr:MAG: hypothetical protein KF824_13165 [Fimbriimonadaceae bacterium]
MVQQITPEPKLEWSTFGDFAAKQFEGSEYRLVMDREIGERPVVYYFSNPGTDKLALLKRTCKELCLNFEVDEKLKKIFIVGPNADAGRSLSVRLSVAFTRLQKLTREYWRLSNKELDNILDAATRQESEAENPIQASDAIFEQEIAINLKSPASRAIMSVLNNVPVNQLVSAVLKGHQSAGLPLDGRARQIVMESMRAGLSMSVPKNQDDAFAANQKLQTQRTISMLDSGADVLLTGSVSASGEVSFYLKIVSDSEEIQAGTFSCVVPITQPDIAEMYRGVSFPEDLLNYTPKLKHKFAWDIDTLNIYQSIGVQKKWNTVEWLDTQLVYPNEESLKISEQMIQLPMLRFATSENGWLVPYAMLNRYPTYSGNWSGIIKAYKMLKRRPSREDIGAYFDSLTDQEITNMPSNPDLWVCREYFCSMLFYPRLMRAALREAKERGVKEFDLPVHELSIEANSDIAQFWVETFHPRLKRRGIANLRGQARLVLQDRVFKDEELADRIAERTLKVVLVIPGASVSQNGERVDYKIDCYAVLAKE